ncbi:hypothetical protein [Microbacterium sp. MYb64]|uniref:hypothetical protein n=1 Tax=Microbacterium sp. MYb64 TaxID=1848691 RepID=UPI0011B08CF5|nr:hypothetical protein [Microbacterium sp. MYb64]
MAGPTVDGEKERLLLAELELGKSVPLPYGESVTMSQLGKLMRPSVIDDVEIAKFGERVSLTLALDGPAGRVEMSYLDVDVASLRPGRYVHGDGSVNDQACDAGSSTR